MTKLSASLPTSTTTGDQSSELISKYRDCAENKRDLKRKLKKFDEDFMAQHSRAPKKSDKEVIRPMYQKYHEVSAKQITKHIYLFTWISDKESIRLSQETNSAGKHRDS